MFGEGNGVRGVIERIALDIMTVDLSDLSRLGAILVGLERVAEGLRETQPVSAGLAKSLAMAVEKIVLDECGGVEDPLGVVAQGIAMLQRLGTSFEKSGQEVPDDPELLRKIATLSGGGERADLSGGDPHGEGPASEWTPGEGPEGERAAATVAPEAALEASPAPGIDASIFVDFASEAGEHLSSAEGALLSLETDPEDGELLNAVFRSFHTIKGAAGFLNLQEVTRVAHAVEDVLDSARKGRLRLNPSILDVAFESIDLLKGLIAGVQAQLEGGEAQPQDISGFVSKVAEVSGPGGAAEAATEGIQRASVIAKGQVEARAASGAEAGPAGQTPAPQDQERGEDRRRPDQHFVRVGTERLDQLVNMVGELVIAQTQVSQNPEILGSDNQKLSKDISQLMKISGEIQEVAMSMRMVPIRATFERMARLVRDLSRKCGKQVAFRMSGEDTELDKNVVEEIVDPLTHMVRNAVDHGVESAEARRAAGKPEKGLVTLGAYHKGGAIVIELQDDGKGLDREKIVKKAVERGLAHPKEELTDEQVYAFIFRPGFSTAEKVSDVSGRGVGMDVVRRNIEKLRGKVEVRSEKGQGSTFTIRLPLTLAIIDGMVIGVGDQRYILPLTSIVRSLRPREDRVFTVMGKGEMVKVQEEVFPLLRLHERFGVTPRHEDPCAGLVVVVEAEGGRCCLLVDELIGMQQVVIKGLSEELRRDECLSGCAILGDGRVGLILDANGLVDQAHGKTSPRMVYRPAS